MTEYDIRKEAEQAVVHPNARNLIEGIGNTDVSGLSFHDAEIDRMLYTQDNENGARIELDLWLPWCDKTLKILFKDVWRYALSADSFGYLSGGFFYADLNGNLFFDAGSWGEILCRSAEFVNFEEIKEALG